MKWAIGVAVGGLLLATTPLASAPLASAATPADPPVLYFTTFRPAALKSATYSLSGSKLVIGLPKVVASLPGADGLAWTSDGDLLVGGEGSGLLSKVHLADGSVQSAPAGVAAAEQVNIWPDGTHAYTAGLPGDLASVPLKPLGPGTKIPLTGDDTAVTAIGFTPKGTFYTTGDRKGNGNFGQFDVATGTTRRTLPGLRGAHGFIFDPFTGDIFLVGSFVIEQVDPANPSRVLSELDVPGMVFDQGLADGHGHLLVTSNTSDIVYINYAATRLVVNAKVVKSTAYIDANLDAVAIAPSLLAAGGIGAVSSTASAPLVVTTKTDNKKVFVAILVGAVLLIALALRFAKGAGRPRLPRR